MECLKNCCEKLMRKKVKEHETQVIKMKMPPASPSVGDGRKGARDDYLISKLPPDGKEVPFVLPTLKPSYIQPKGPRYPNLHSGLQSSARYTYAERKAELLGSNHISYGNESKFHGGQTADYNSPGSTRRRHVHKNYSPQSQGWSLECGHQRLSSSMFDLSNSQSHLQHLDSISSTVSSTSSVVGSLGSSLDSIPLAGDERELGKMCVRLNYEEAVEQVWITLVQCSDLSIPGDCVEQQKIRCKGIITMPKPIQFKTSVKDYSQDVAFMETFVFALRLQQLRCSSLLLRLQTHAPRKRTVAECILSLRELGTQEAEHWLNLCPPSKSSVCHSELQLSICFQPVNGRIQLQVLAAQNLPAFSSPLTHTFFVKAELYQSGLVVMKKNTHALKASDGQCQWAETFHFPLPAPALDHDPSLSVKLYSRSSVRRKQYLGQVQLGLDSTVPEVVAQWKDMMAHPEKVVTAWHRLGTS
ncbi:tandem C2 domains nuclear protein [Thalassophryne amazonica]|uniref:tandem C2 domains nuclear protein n=1 Tax=Thalassophryne amazonica TaxID=390379 RepID=UPI0014725935|nr:tandem C2 domains nuclear protein [Thalassophryne amazonica]XP_034015208.1 tandem C2 domains nuclear protein [Thalassophryne amazonica]